MLETLFGLVPIERVRELHDEHMKFRRSQEIRHERLHDHYRNELKDAVRQAENIVAHLSAITFDRRNRVYSVRVDIAPEMMQGGWQSAQERRWVAEHVGHLVAHEIASGRYLEQSYETEMRQRYGAPRSRHGFGNY